MNFALSDEQVLLREAARGSLARFKTIEAARAALEDPTALPDLWPIAIEAGWPGLLIGEQHGGAGLGAFDALLIAEECGRVLAVVPLLGLMPAAAILDAVGDETLEAAVAAASCGLRTCPLDHRESATGAGRWMRISGFERAAAPRAAVGGDQVTLDGEVGVRARCARGRAAGRGRRRRGRRAGRGGRESSARRGHGRVRGPLRRDSLARPRRVRAVRRGGGSTLDAGVLADAWYLAHALIAAESIGAVETCLDVSVAYAKERFTFGRAIGSYQAIKHELTEVLRRLENARGLQYYAGWARDSAPDEFALAASAARSAAGAALDFASRAMINVHGGIGATWEHDAPLFFRRAQLSRRLLAGTHDATDRVAERVMAAA